MKVRPAILWVLAVMSALVGAMAGIVFEGLLDKHLMIFAHLSNFGLAEDVGIVEEVFSTIIGATLGAAFVGLLGFAAYKLFLSVRR